ncbi:asparagine synthase (glutamine-hydrolyzing) [Parendozoicomonas haliclonae]|uniref:asparagine synthase (glutamine-hydrolyzing) n=1 Tax=Parendozoicomonas haliclonae TaxID=1960125 RepID=A0A1X7AS15_9GAMM|nr:asparagine synthase (glutamine-hydrolyzing) [Parendozoicomonas haliclonae]SMA50888.1 Asparagine synthetase [glutamine-hydrolyzing] 1 [Parendozoicomonas haliclonae]
MCGIAGLVDLKKQSKVEYLKKISEVQLHRGPDDCGLFFENYEKSQVGLAHQRLSILDLSSHAHQPMIFDPLAMVYNGEVYNFQEIRIELEKDGYTFDSNSDTEVILKAYHKWGVDAVQKFNGMFAIAIFDSKNQTLTLIRDRAGVKPLYWYHQDGLFMFASELKSFHEHPNFSKQINKNGLALFLQYGYISEPHTIFKNTHKLKAGHILELDIRSLKFNIKKYWDVVDYYNKSKLNISEQEAIIETERLLKSACEYRMVSDVPVGIFLSGGYDSSTVTALLQSNRTEKIKTFSIGFHEEKFNEAHHAKKVADYLGTDHTEYYCTQRDALDVLPKLVEIWDEPFADSSIIPTTLVSKLAREQVTVSLSADGGDELFGGYDKYTKAQYYHKMFNRIPGRKTLAKTLHSIHPEKLGLDLFINNFSGKYRSALSIMSVETQNEAMRTLQMHFNDDELGELINANAGFIRTGFHDIASLNENLNDLDKMMAIDFKTYQLDNILTKVDRATMSVSLEGREPLLDYRLIEYVARLDPSLKINEGTKKYLLKKVAHKYLPKEIMERPKMGFGVPIVDWFSDELKHYLDHYLSPRLLSIHGFFNVDMIMKIKKEYDAGKKRHIGKLWVILIFQMWYERWMMSDNNYSHM